MPRPSAGALTGAGFALASGTKYTKASGTATAVADTGTGQCAIQATTPGVPIAPADLAAHVASFNALGITAGDPGGRDLPCAPGTIYVGYST